MLLRISILILLFASCRSHEPTSKHQPAEAVSTKALRRSPEGTVRLLYDAVNKKDYRTAYNLWQRSDGSNASGKSFEEFANGYAQTKSANVAITDSVRIEGAAGSLYATVPVRVDAVTTTSHQTFNGEYVLRKINIEPGSDTLPWHIESGHLVPATAP